MRLLLSVIKLLFINNRLDCWLLNLAMIESYLLDNEYGILTLVESVYFKIRPHQIF